MLMGRLGDSTGVAATQVSVVSQATEGTVGGKNVLVIGDLSLAQGELFAKAAVSYRDARLQVRARGAIARAMQFLSPDAHGSDKELDDALYGADAFTGIASFQSPYDDDRTVVALLASEPVNLPQMISGLADVDVNADVQGDLSIFTGDGMLSFAAADRYWVGALPVWMKAAFWLSQRPWLLALAGVLAAIALAWPAYLFLSRQERKRLQAVEK
jgi:cellulose synthase (UDP-forming)